MWWEGSEDSDQPGRDQAERDRVRSPRHQSPHPVPVPRSSIDLREAPSSCAGEPAALDHAAGEAVDDAFFKRYCPRVTDAIDRMAAWACD